MDQKHTKVYAGGTHDVDLYTLDWRKGRLVPLPLAAMPAEMRQALTAAGPRHADADDLSIAWSFDPHPTMRVYLGPGFRSERKRLAKKMGISQAALTNPMVLASSYIGSVCTERNGLADPTLVQHDKVLILCLARSVLSKAQYSFFKTLVAGILTYGHFANEQTQALWDAAEAVVDNG